MSDQINIVDGQIDRYNGILIDTELSNISNEQFREQLNRKSPHNNLYLCFRAVILSDANINIAESLAHWTSNSFKTIWFKVNVKHSGIVPILAENGFDFHHAKAGFVMMARWLPTDLPANFPVFAHTMIGVGGLVVNDKDQILTITEKQAIIPGAWKLPGGYVEPSNIYIPMARPSDRHTLN